MKDSTKRSVTIVVVIVIFLFLILLGTLFLGIKKIGNVVMFIIGAFFVLAIFGVVVWLVYWLFFKKRKFDATYMNKKNLMKAGSISKPSNLNDIYLSGDKGHSRVRVGKITGYCRIQVIRKNVIYDAETGEPVRIPDKNNKRNLIEQFELEKEEQDVFVVQRAGFPMSLFMEEMVIRVNPEAHDELVGDVTLFGFSIIPISEYFFLNDDFLDVRKIDFSILKEAERGIFFESLKDTKEIIDKAIGLDSGHKKDIEKKNLYEIPQMPTNQNQQ
jgi:hypothetical protein